MESALTPTATILTDKGQASKACRKQNIHPSVVYYLSEIGMTSHQVYSSLQAARLVHVAEGMHTDICKYVQHGQEHGHGIKIHYIISILHKNEPSFPENGKLRMLLWHGTKAEYVGPILETGFKPPTALGQMFGRGIYFADRASKSVNYSDAQNAGDVGYLLLCDVIIGDYYNAKTAKPTFTSAPLVMRADGTFMLYDSVKCTGENVPDRAGQKRIGNLVIPFGETIKNTKFTDFTVLFNEYIVYSTDKIKIKYLVKFELTPTRSVDPNLL